MAIRPRYISLFSGAGGLDLAIRIALPDAQCLCYVEGEIPAAEVLAARMHEGSLDDAPIWSDVRTFDGHPWRGKVDGIVGGFPCQDLSVAGKRAGIEGERSGLWAEFARIIGEVRPGFVFIENVSGLLANEPMRRVLGDLSALGFDAEWISLSASAVGAPHKRERVFVLAYAAGRIRFANQPIKTERLPIGGGGVQLALPPQRGCGELREPSGGDGQPHGGGGDVDNATGSKYQGIKTTATPGHQREYPISSRELANSGDRLIPQPGREPEGRAGAGSAGAAVGNATDDNRRSRERGAQTGIGTDGEWWRGSSGTGYNMAHAGQQGLEERRCESGNAGQECATAEQNGAELADTAGMQPEQYKGSGPRSGKTEGSGAFSELAGCGDSLFPPAPNDLDAWSQVLVRRPWMRPAISQAETESALRGVDDELANLVVQQRTDALRAAGNGVVALQGAVAFVELVRRADEAMKETF